MTVTAAERRSAAAGCCAGTGVAGLRAMLRRKAATVDATQPILSFIVMSYNAECCAILLYALLQDERDEVPRQARVTGSRPSIYMPLPALPALPAPLPTISYTSRYA